MTIAHDIDDGVQKRHRSPNYPTVGLQEAIERVRNLYGKDGKAGAPAKIAAVHIGFSKPHGQAMSVLAALKRFGLVAEANGRIAPTQRAIEILNLPPDDPRCRKALRDAVLEPALYRELIEQHKETGWPADDVLASELVTYKNFNPRSAGGFVRDFKDSIVIAGLSEGDALESEQENDPNAEEAIEQPPKQYVPPRGKLIMATAPSPLVQDASQALSRKVAEKFLAAKTRTYSFPLSQDVRAELNITGDIASEDLDTLRDYIEIAIKALSRKAKTEEQ